MNKQRTIELLQIIAAIGARYERDNEGDRLVIDLPMAHQIWISVECHEQEATECPTCADDDCIVMHIDQDGVTLGVLDARLGDLPAHFAKHGKAVR